MNNFINSISDKKFFFIILLIILYIFFNFFGGDRGFVEYFKKIKFIKRISRKKFRNKKRNYFFNKKK